MKTQTKAPFVFALISVTLMACGRTPVSANHKAPQTVDLSPYASEIQTTTDTLMKELDALPMATASASDQSFSQAVAYAYPNAQSATLVLPSQSSSVRPAVSTTSGSGPYGGTWSRSNGSFVNARGETINAGGAYGFNPYGLGAAGGYYNQSNGNRVYGSVIYLPGFGLGAAVHGCSPSTGQCGTAVVGIGVNRGGYVACRNGSCSGNQWY